jgi:hypothetical protein
VSKAAVDGNLLILEYTAVYKYCNGIHNIRFSTVLRHPRRGHADVIDVGTFLFIKISIISSERH